MIFFVAVVSAQAQNGTVSGNIIDSEGLPLIGANVVVKGTTIGSISDVNGNFTIANVPAGETIIVASFIGYNQEEQTVNVGAGQTAKISFKLIEDITNLEELVVIGYGKVKKDDATGSVVAIKSDDFNKGAITSPQELISGKTAGVVVTTNSGEPGGGSQIRIRGGSSLRASNDPLIVIDGFPVDNSGMDGMANPLSTINPNDIESMTVLKDASATAIYGSRASNGVIIITTKKGTKKGLNVTYNGNFSIGTPTKLTEVYSAKEFAAIVNDRIENHGLTAAAADRLGSGDTDWQDQVYRNSFSTDHNISVFGKTENMPYRVSLGHTIENGLLEGSGNNKTTVAVNLNPSFLDDHLKVTVNAKGMNINNDFSNTDALGSSVQMDPTQVIRNGNTEYGGYFAWVKPSDEDQLNGEAIDIATDNPLAQLAYRDNKSNAIRSISNLQLDYKFHFLPDLRANLNVGYDHFKSDGHNNTDTLAAWSVRNIQSNVSAYERISKSKLLDFYLNYTKEISSIESKIDATGGYSYQHFYKERTDKNRPWEMTNGEYVGSDTVTEKGEYYLVSFFGRLNYTFKDRYLFTATIRNDGSSRFSEDNRWGLFPSYAFAWKVNKEAFLADVATITDLKLRLGYGLTGQQDVGDPNNPNSYYPYLPTYSTSTSGAYYQFGDTFYPTGRPGAYDANLKWEETTTINFGLDIGLYNERITGTIDLYQRKTSDLLNQVPIANGTNFSNQLITNVGTMENKGIEIEINTIPISNSDLSWEIGANLTYNKNEITKLNLSDDPNYTGYETGGIAGGVGNNVQINSVGYPKNTFHLFKQVYDLDGNPIEGLYIDKTGEGGIVSGNNLNKYYLGSPDPDYLIGINSKVKYKQFDASFSGRISIGNMVYNNNNSNRALYSNVYNQAGYLANIPTAVEETGFSTAQYWSDIYLEDGSFFRMDNINVGYNFNKIFNEKLTGRIAFTVQNAFVITKYSGLDPEVTNGIENSIYPRPRVFLLGLNVNF